MNESESLLAQQLYCRYGRKDQDDYCLRKCRRCRRARLYRAQKQEAAA